MTSKRIYIIKSKTGKKTVLVNATTKAAAERYVMATYFDTHVATHEELFELFKNPDTEIIDCRPDPQTDIAEVPGVVAGETT